MQHKILLKSFSRKRGRVVLHDIKEKKDKIPVTTCTTPQVLDYILLKSFINIIRNMDVAS
jgi:hypothetical protein